METNEPSGAERAMDDELWVYSWPRDEMLAELGAWLNPEDADLDEADLLDLDDVDLPDRVRAVLAEWTLDGTEQLDAAVVRVLVEARVRRASCG